MRIAVVNWSSRRVGGIETYLNALIPALERAEHQVAFCCETDGPAPQNRISLAAAAPFWCVTDIGADKVLAGLRSWQPDLIYVHKIMNPELETELLKIAPAVFFAHDYQRTCISGNKTHQFPMVQPCDRRFGAACLLHYFPHRCGGLNPIKMMQLYRQQTRRLELLRRYDAVVTHSEHMLRELIKNGISRDRISTHPFLVERGYAEQAAGAVERKAGDDIQLIFCGRMERLKGGETLLDAVPQVQRALGKKILIVFAGDGRQLGKWKRRAAGLQHKHPAIEVKFVGWGDQSFLDKLFAESDLLVVPSLWPEPFGLVGPEAGLRGLPAAAFAVGGISEWLVDGVNGHLAPAAPPTAKGLADAIIRCLENRERYAQLRQGSLRLAAEFNAVRHLHSLMTVFNRVVSQRAGDFTTSGN